MAFETRVVAAIGSLAVALLWWVVPMAPAGASGVSVVPRPDHVVVLVLENHSVSTILANPNAPYINSLATSGANMTQSFANTHPSQPNYIALFSGSTNGVTDDSCPHAFSTDNLGAQALAAGIGFTGFSESMPSVGYAGCSTGRYARKHNPWVNFSNVPAASNQPLTNFPTDYSTLPAVSFVIPNLDHDMHDGTIAQGDTWIHDNLDGYVQWARTHNSLLVLTFDEDDNTQANQIATVIVGQRVQPGQYSEHIDHYSVLRTIEDGLALPALGNAATAAPILDIWTSDANAPQAAFTVSCVDLTCSADGAASTAATGALTAWDWTWGDGTTTSGRTSSHTFAEPGDVTVTLRVTDDSGRSAQISHSASPRAPGGGTAFAADGFGRMVASGLGTADLGGAWTTASPASLSVTGTTAKMRTTAGSGPAAYLNTVSSTDTDATIDVTLDKLGTGSGTYFALIGRGNTTNSYRGKIVVTTSGTVTTYLTKVIAGTETTLTQSTITGLTYTPGDTLHLRLQVVGTGTTTLKFNVWKNTDPEPTTWRLTTTDTTPTLQNPGGIGLWTYLSSAATNAPVTLTIDNLTARSTTGVPPANVPPTAAFTATTTDLTATLNATASHDTDGTITTYRWDYGDTTTDTGATTTHTYTTPGTYQITLTVTDNQGATDSTTHPVTVTTPPPANVPPTAAFTATTTDLTATLNATASHDTDGTITTYRWDYGDTTTDTGATTTHVYAAAGTYQITLTVTDNQGATDTTTHPVTVTTPPPDRTFASDGFGRMVASGLGTADLGGAWTTASPASLSVTGTTAKMRTTAGSGPAAYLNTVSSTDTDATIDVTLDKLGTGSGTYFALIGRGNTTNSYRGKIVVTTSGTVTTYLTKVIAGTETNLTQSTITGLTYTPGDTLHLRLQVVGTGTTTLKFNVWKNTDPEPTTWRLTTTDTTPTLQNPGGIGLWTYLSSAATNAPVTLTIDNLTAQHTN